MNPEDMDRLRAGLALEEPGLLEIQLPSGEERASLRRSIDYDALHRAVLQHMLGKMGSFAEDWYYHILPWGHVEAYNPHVGINEQEQGEIWRVEKIVKRKLRIYGYSMFQRSRTPTPSDEDLAERWRPFPQLLDEVGKICGCWLIPPAEIALLRSGNYLVANVQEDQGRDMEMWRYRKVKT